MSRRIKLETRERMVEQTSTFLSWALRDGCDLPRIPIRRVDAGGFSGLWRIPGARTVLDHWWKRTLDQLRS